MELNILCNNVARSPTCHAALLAQATQARADVILVQEPTLLDKENRVTLFSQDFGWFGPSEDWTKDPPRTLTYVRKGLKASGMTNTVRDITGVTVEGVEVYNVYVPVRENVHGATAAAVREIPRTKNVIVMGDFNRGFEWNSEGEAGPRLDDWAEEIQLLNDPEVPTRGTRTLDFAFSNNDQVEAGVSELHSGSDHRILWAWIKREGGSEENGTKPNLELKKKVNMVLCKKSWRQGGGSLREWKNELEEQLQIHSEWSKVTIKKTPWWNKDLTREVRIVQGTDPQDKKAHKKARRRLRGKVRKARSQFWNKAVNEVKSDADLYKLASWRKPVPNTETKALQGHEDKSEEEQITIIAKSLLEQKAEDHGNSNDDPTASETNPNRITWKKLSMETVRRNMFEVASKAPGADGITVDLLRDMEVDMDRLTELVNQDLDEGVATMKEADVLLIPKHGRDPSTTKGWRPISLLSVMAKGVERAVAEWMGGKGLEQGWFGPNQAGGIPGRSTTDIILKMLDSIERHDNVKKNPWRAVVFMDVKGAFNEAKKGNLYKVLRDKGLPENIVKWTVDFMSSRTITPKRGGMSGTPFELDDGLPQGSPVSPVLFSLLLSKVLTGKGNGNRYGYADDIAVRAFGETLEQVLSNAERLANELAEEVKELGLEIEPTKTEAIVFRRSKAPIPQGELTVQGRVVKTSKNVRYLGVHLDDKMTFRKHIETRTALGWGVANLIKKLSRDMGLRVEGTIKLIKTVLIPTLTYGSEVWWKGKNDPNGQTKGQRQQGLLETLEKPLKSCKREALGTSKGCPLKVLDWETGIPKLEDILDNLRDKASVRLNSKEKEHPTRGSDESPKTRLNGLRSYVGQGTKGEEPWTRTNVRRLKVRVSSEEEHEKSFLRQHPDTRWAYVTMDEDEARYQVKEQDGKVIKQGKITRGDKNVTLDAGLRAVRTAAFEGLKSPHGKRHRRYNVRVHVRDPELAKELGKDKGPSTSRQEVSMLKSIEKNKMRILELDRCPEYFALEKEELSEEKREEIASCGWLKEEAERRRGKRTGRSWEGTAPEDYQTLTQENGRLVKLRGDRKVVGHILAERTGVGMFNEHRLKIGKGPVVCRCGTPRERGHFLECESAEHNGQRLLEIVPRKWKNNPGVYLLGEGVKDFGMWVKETGYHFGVLRETEANSETDREIQERQDQDLEGDRRVTRGKFVTRL